MYILTIHGKEREGAYSVQDQEGQHVLYLFAEGDDAMRYAITGAIGLRKSVRAFA